MESKKGESPKSKSWAREGGEDKGKINYID